MATTSPSRSVEEALDHLRARPRLARKHHALLALVGIIPTHDDQPAIHRAEIMTRLGVTRARVAELVQYLRHNVPELGDALISGPSGYRRTLDEGRVAAYRRHRLGHARTMVLTVRRVLEPVLGAIERRAGDDRRGRETKKAITMIRRNLDRVIEDLETLT